MSMYNLGCYNSSPPSPPLKRISSSKFIHVSKSCGYYALIVASGSQVASSLSWCFHSTFTNGICLFRNCFTSRARIALALHHMKNPHVLIYLVLVVCATHQSGISEASTHETHYVIWSTLERVPNDKPQANSFQNFI